MSAETKWSTTSFLPSCITALAKTQKSKEKKKVERKKEETKNKKGKDINVSSSTTGHSNVFLLWLNGDAEESGGREVRGGEFRRIGGGE